MMRNLIIAALFSFLASSVFAQWVPWQVAPQRERRDVTGKGETVPFSQVDLIAGMTYKVHAEDRVDVGDGGIADARYYFKLIPLPPTGVLPVGLKMKYDVASEDWFNSGIAPAQQTFYQTSHVYDAFVTSRGVPLAFRFFDREDPPSSGGFYDDNSGKITIEVSRETPGLAIQFDTLDFGNVQIGRSKMMLDSIQGYGNKGYQLESISPAVLLPFSIVSQRSLPFTLIDATNEFQFTFAPTATGRQEVKVHLISSSSFGADKDRIIVLIGTGVRPEVSVLDDTLDFGTLGVGATRTLGAFFENKGSLDVTINSLAVMPASQPFSGSGMPLPLAIGKTDSIPVTFAPQAAGLYFASIDALLDDGSAVRFYAKGAAGKGRPFFTQDTLYFDTVIIGLSRVLVSTFLNKEDAPGTGGPLTATHSTNSNPEFSVIGNPGPFTKGANSGEVYTVTFAPTTHIPNYGVHTGEFTLFFADQGPKTLYFVGHDHLRLEAKLFIDTFNYVVAGKEITVRQLLRSDLSGTLSAIQNFSQTITYDQTYFELLSVEKGAIIAGPEWTLTSTLTPGRADLTVTTSSSRFTAGGEIFKLRFRARPAAPIGAYTLLPQLVDFGGLFEPLASSETGKITVVDICTPVRVMSGMLANYIEQNTPNPVTASTRIQFSVGETEAPQHVSLRVIDGVGREVQMLVDEVKSPGVYSVLFDASHLAPGMYTYLFRCGEYTRSRQMLIAR